MKIKSYKIPQYMQNGIYVVCVDDVPLCAVRSKKSAELIEAKLNGQDVEVLDKRIAERIDHIINLTMPTK